MVVINKSKIKVMRKILQRSTVLITIMLLLFLAITEAGAQQTLADVKGNRGLTDDDVLSAVKTFMPRGGRDLYFAFCGTGNSGTMVVYGIPSMRIYKYVGVFSPEPWQGYGFDDESTLLLKKGSRDNRMPAYGNTYFPALSETDGKYNGKYLFHVDGANSRVALTGLDDFETTQVIMHPLFVSSFPAAVVTQNTEFVIQTTQFPATWDEKEADIASEYEQKFKAGITMWKMVDYGGEVGSGHHGGRMIPEESFAVELPPLTLGYFDAGRAASHGLVIGIADYKGSNYIYVFDYMKAEQLSKTRMNGFNVVTANDAINASVFALIPVSGLPQSVKTDPSGDYFITASDIAYVFDFGKVKNALNQKQFASAKVLGIPTINAEQIKYGEINLGNKVMDIAFDYRDNVVYASVFDDKKIVRWNYKDLAIEKELALSFKPGHLMTPQGNTADPHSNYLTVTNKESLYDNTINIGPTRPSYQHLIDISSDEMRDIYTMSIPQANLYGSVSVVRTTIKPIIRYPMGTNTRTGEISRFRTLAGQERIERLGNRVHIFGTLIRSHIHPEIVEVEEGDIVTFHLTNLERAEDETHGFTVSTYGIHGSFEPGKTASLTFEASRPGAFPYYCTEFCSALHLEMQGILMVRPKGYKPKAEDLQEIELSIEELQRFKKNYEDKLKVIDETQAVINSVVVYLKENNYQNYPYVEALVIDAFDQLELAKVAKANYERDAADGKWRDAFLWAEQYFQYQVKAADVGLRAKNLLADEINK
jgi:nitrous-oxide reductase